ncbi:unnamed protein product [Ceratitis capitata]|uniref:(Mediterranean fruit fly) hypothetical protein n=1 Tax=Ceratitis capitata TaxID=7213 RepID=A0A811UMU6_CERCA|nr:unnamed protein product [Ceratitis capitata]
MRIPRSKIRAAKVTKGVTPLFARKGKKAQQVVSASTLHNHQTGDDKIPLDCEEPKISTLGSHNNTNNSSYHIAAHQWIYYVATYARIEMLTLSTADIVGFVPPPAALPYLVSAQLLRFNGQTQTLCPLTAHHWHRVFSTITNLAVRLESMLFNARKL